MRLIPPDCTAGYGFQLVDRASEESGFADLLNAAIEHGRPAQTGAWGTSGSPAVQQHLARVSFAPDQSSPTARRGGLIIRALAPTNDDD